MQAGETGFIGEERLGREWSQRKGIIVEVDKTFGEFRDTVKMHFNGIGTEDRSVLFRYEVFMANDVQFGMVGV